MQNHENGDAIDEEKLEVDVPDSSYEIYREETEVDEPESSDVGDETPSEVDVSETEEILTSTAASPDTRARRIIKSSLRWIIGVLIIFALGFMSAILLLYVPERDGKSQLKEDLTKTETRMESLENEIFQLEDEISNYEASLEEHSVAYEKLQVSLEEERSNHQVVLKTANLHILILSALADVNAARVALMNEDIPGAKVHLTNTSETFEALAESVDPEQRDKVLAMQNRLALVIAEIDADPEVALTDLEVLANNLTMLENTFFAKP
jgi:hypothetical protein